MQETEAAFDRYAASYDEEFTFSSVGKFQRERVWRFLSKHISPLTHPEVLELNCGTGEDALWFAKKGFKITATDISNEMLQVAKRKLQKENATVLQSGIAEVGETLYNKKFDLIFSDFGGLNCLDAKTLKEMDLVFSRLLKPGGRMMFVVMSRNCKWEQWYFKRKNEPRKAFRRRSAESSEAVISGTGFPTWYYAPSEIASFFAGHFSVNAFKPVGITLPPSYLDNYFRKHPVRLRMLNMLEKGLGGFSWLADHADHFIIDLVKK